MKSNVHGNKNRNTNPRNKPLTANGKRRPDKVPYGSNQEARRYKARHLGPEA